MEESKTLIPVYIAPNEALFSLAQSLLDNAEVEYYTKGTNLHLAYGGPRIIETMAENVDRAKEILKDFIEGTPAIPDDKQKDEFSFAASIGGISVIILLIILCVVFVRC